MPQHQPETRDDSELIALLRSDPEQGITRIFTVYYDEVCRHIYRLLPDQQTCEDIAQSIFMELWQKRKSLDIRTSFGAYLHRMARSRTLNYIRDNKRYQYSAEEDGSKIPLNESDPADQMTDQELEEQVHKAIEMLPERCRLVFALSRFEQMSYKEIAENLAISVKTVENQMSKALHLLRKAVQEYHRGNPL